MSRIKIPAAQIEIDPVGGTIWVHNAQGVTVMRVSVEGSLEQPVETGKTFVDVRATYTNHIQVTTGPDAVVET